jgi:hypothetical protein
MDTGGAIVAGVGRTKGEHAMPHEYDPNSDYDRMREDAAREAAYIEAEREETEAAERESINEADLEDVPF